MPDPDAASLHQPVMPAEVLALLGAARGGTFVDCTLGLGGHSELILGASDETRLSGSDQEGEAMELANPRLERFGDRVRFVKANFSQIKEIIDAPVDGVLADLGVSSLQLDSETRGFSFRHDALLDMRMDPA